MEVLHMKECSRGFWRREDVVLYDRGERERRRCPSSKRWTERK